MAAPKRAAAHGEVRGPAAAVTESPKPLLLRAACRRQVCRVACQVLNSAQTFSAGGGWLVTPLTREIGGVAWAAH